MTKSEVFSQAHRTARFYYEHKYSHHKTYQSALVLALRQAWSDYRMSKLEEIDEEEEKEIERFYSVNERSLRKAHMMD
jgi:hypothetical protein